MHSLHVRTYVRIVHVHPESFRSNAQNANAFACRNLPRVDRNDEFACVYLCLRACVCVRLQVLFAIDRVHACVRAHICIYVGKVIYTHVLYVSLERSFA